MKKKMFAQAIICVGLFSIILGGYFCLSLKVDKQLMQEEIDTLELIEDYSFISSVDVSREEDLIVFKGWAYRKGVERIIDMRLVLSEINEKEELILDSDDIKDENICEFVSDNEGRQRNFVCKIDEKCIELGKCYEIQYILIYEQQEDKGSSFRAKNKVSFKRYLYNGEMYTYNPKELKKPDITDREITDVINEGELFVYESDAGIWIYKYNNKLFYIIRNEYGDITETGDYCVPVMIYTSRVELLPKEAREDGFEHIGAYYRSKSCGGDDIGEYQIVCVELSKNYPITYINTGIFNVRLQEWENNFKISLMK